MICAVLGILVIGFSLGAIARSVLYFPRFTKRQMSFTDIADPGFRRTQIRFFLVGVAVFTIGIVLFWLGGA